MGAQLRYLIICDAGILGAMGFGPAAFYLSCRDLWVGWSAESQRANLNQVIGLSRFLIRPTLRCANLASHCYSLVLKRVACDWLERYGVKPVLVETYVDRSTHTGKSLAAANWQRLGQSLGLGRASPNVKVRSKSIKDVWIYELTPQARVQLQRRAHPIIVPRSIFRGLEGSDWVEQELDGLDLGDETLERRLGLMLESRWQRPGNSFYTSFGCASAGKAAYRLMENPKAELTFQNLLAPHINQTHRRMAAESVVLVANDTTTLSYNTLKHTQGLGAIGDKRKPGRGLLLHSTQAFRLDGIPLGCASARLWSRPEESDTAQRQQQSVADKESGRWLEAYQSAAALA